VEDIDERAHVLHASYHALLDLPPADGLLRPCAVVRALLVETGVAAAATQCEVTILPDRPLQVVIKWLRCNYLFYNYMTVMAAVALNSF
jgi:hypothetical protein